jgi:hypothetical protein
MPHRHHRADRGGAGRQVRPDDPRRGVLEQADEVRGGEDVDAAIAHGVGGELGRDGALDLVHGADVRRHRRVLPRDQQ